MGMIAEFREFVARGNVVDLAVAVVIGAAFGKIVTALVDGLIMPLVGVAMGGASVSEVWTEPVTFPKWERRGQHAEVLGAHAQPLVLTALGGSPGGTVEGQVVRFADLESLEQAAPGSLAGRIAFVDYRMERARDGHGYGPASRIRHGGPSAAIEW